MNKLFFLLPFLISFQFFSQENQQNAYLFGKISQEELTMRTYKKDTTANAVVLFNYGNIEVINDGIKFFIRTKYYKKIKILNKKGEEHATVSIPIYYSKDYHGERVRKVKAITHNSNEVNSYLSEKQVYTNTINDRWKEVTFTLPNVKSGSIIEYEYVLESEHFYNFNGWEFQSDIPTVYSELHALIPGNWVYNKRLIGLIKLDKEEVKIKKNCFYGNSGEQADCEEVYFAMKNIPAFIEEDYMTNKGNYLSKIEFELAKIVRFDGTEKKYTTTWKDTDKNLKSDGSFGRQIKNVSFFEKIIPIEILKESNDLTRSKLIYNFIRDHFKWNEEYRIFSNEVDVKKAYKNKIGNISEINLALINALKAANINSKIILSATRNYGLPAKIHPVIADFNYLFAYVTINDKIYLLDATEKLLPFGSLPFRSLNGYGRVLDFDSASFWYDIESKVNSYKRTFLEIEVSDNQINGKLKINENGYFALNKRNRIKNDSQDGYLMKIESENNDISIIDYQNLNLNELDNILEEKFEIKFNDYESVGNMLYINPFLNRLDSNPFQLEERTYPVDFGYRRKYAYAVKINVANIYEIKSVPENIAITLPNDGGTFVSKTNVTGNTINIFSQISFNRSSYFPQEYVYLKEFYRQIIKTQNSLITLEKI